MFKKTTYNLARLPADNFWAELKPCFLFKRNPSDGVYQVQLSHRAQKNTNVVLYQSKGLCLNQTNWQYF
jgi:hypothetical protein